MSIPFIPKYIRQVINDSPRKIVTAERWNELLNLLITQGDYNAEAIKTILDRISINGEEGVLLTLTAADINAVGTTGDETIAGVKTFDSFPISPSSAPTTDYQFANKKYVDDNASYSKAEQLSPTTAALYGLEANAVPDEAFAAIGKKLPVIDKNFKNILRLKLQQSLKANDIDAWSDLLADASGINAEASSGYELSGGRIYAGIISITSSRDSNQVDFGVNPEHQSKVGQIFKAAASGTLNSVTLTLERTGSPTDAVQMKLYSGDKEVLIATSNTITVTSSKAYEFIFSNANIVAGESYFFEVYRTGATDNMNCYKVRQGSGYADGEYWYIWNAVWTIGSGCLYFTIKIKCDPIVVWNAVTSTEVLGRVAITADQVADTGTITWCLSDDGTSWIEIPALDTMQAVNFDTTSVYLKCELTGDAEVRAVAWGGY